MANLTSSKGKITINDREISDVSYNIHNPEQSGERYGTVFFKCDEEMAYYFEMAKTFPVLHLEDGRKVRFSFQPDSEYLIHEQEYRGRIRLEGAVFN